MTARLEAVGLYRFFHVGDEETLALRGVSMTVDRGEMVTITGPSGSGKSTLLACLAGLDEPDGGVVRIDGERLTRRSEAERAAVRNRRIGMLFQTGNLLEGFSVAENVAIAQRIGRAPNPRSVAATLDRLGLSARAESMPHTLSGGETARAGLAVALANDPAVVLADEPTGELDSENAQAVMALLREHSDAGTAVVVVTHNAAVADGADRVIRLHDGLVVDQ